jgi:hypothetical protein
MILQENRGAHSAQVEMRLIVNGASISVTHIIEMTVRVRRIDPNRELSAAHFRADA